MTNKENDNQGNCDKNHVFFSVTIPAFKSLYFAECIDSVLSQTYTDFELVIVNDASPEDLDSIIEKYTDSRIRYYKNEKGFGAEHVVGNWNRCLELATGDFIICMGDDDKLKPTCLEQYANIILKYPDLDVYHARFELIDEKSRTHSVNYTDNRDEYETTFTLIERRFHNRLQFIGDNLFRTSVLREKGGFVDLPCAWFSDELSVVMMAGTKGIASTDDIGFQYRVNSSTISNNSKFTRLKIDAAYKAENWYKSFINENGSIDKVKRITLHKLLESRIKKVINTNIAFDMSFNLTMGWKCWQKECTAFDMIKNWFYALRIRASRVLNVNH